MQVSWMQEFFFCSVHSWMYPKFKKRGLHVVNLHYILQLLVPLPVCLQYQAASIRVSLVGKLRSGATWRFTQDDTVSELAREKPHLLPASPILCLNPSSILLHFYYPIKWMTVYEFIPRHIIALLWHQRTGDRQKIQPDWLFSEAQLFHPVRRPCLRLILRAGTRL